MDAETESVGTVYVRDGAHEQEVLDRIRAVRRTLWIGTADLKDVYVRHGAGVRPLLGELAQLIERGVNVRLIHAKEPGPNFRADFDRYPALAAGLERVLCPRTHFKLMIFDLETAYIGSANLTGAGMGIKGGGKRNFEAGVFTGDAALVNAAAEQFDYVWRGEGCEGCLRKAYCGDRPVED